MSQSLSPESSPPPALYLTPEAQKPFAADTGAFASADLPGASRLAAALESGGIGWWHLDLASGALSTSPVFRAHFGLAPDQTIAYESLFDTIHPADRARVRDAKKNALDTRQDYEAEYRVFWPDESVHWVRAQGRPIYNEASQPVAMSGVTQDITRSRAAAEQMRTSEARYRALIEQASDAIFITDLTSIIQYVNPSACALTGYTQPELLGINVTDLLQPEDSSEVTVNLRRVASGETLVTRRRIRRRDGAMLVVEGSHKRLSDGRFVAIVRDITPTIRHEEEIETLNRQLHRAVYESSHRIKNHLQVLAAMVDIATMDGTETIPTEQFRKLGASIRALSIVHDELTMRARQDATSACISAESLLTKVLSIVEQASGRNRVTYQIEDALLPTKACTSLALLVNELASNAIKHGRSATAIRLTIGDSEGVLTVEDDGPGFADDFDPVQAANTGLDVVLSLSRTDLHGTVRFENRTERAEGGGRVVVTFPIAAGEAAEAEK